MSSEEYSEYKMLLFEDDSQMPPLIGKKPNKIYDLRNPDDYIEFVTKQREENRRRYAYK